MLVAEALQPVRRIGPTSQVPSPPTAENERPSKVWVDTVLVGLMTGWRRWERSDSAGCPPSQRHLDSPFWPIRPVRRCNERHFSSRWESSRSISAISDTAATQQAFGLNPDSLANCVVVSGKREGEERFAACVVLANTRADVNGLVKRYLDVRKASFLPVDGPSA